MEQKPIDFLHHIFDETEFLLSVLEQLSHENFLQNGTAQRACIRSLEIIGEAKKNLPEDFWSVHPEIEWSSLAQFHGQLIYQYFDVDNEIVWEIMGTKIPELNRLLRVMIEEVSD
jgi:uncharacterized protein with HEPN domain